MFVVVLVRGLVPRGGKCPPPPGRLRFRVYVCLVNPRADNGWRSCLYDSEIRASGGNAKCSDGNKSFAVIQQVFLYPRFRWDLMRVVYGFGSE